MFYRNKNVKKSQCSTIIFLFSFKQFETLCFMNDNSGVELVKSAYQSINTGIDNLQIRERLDGFFTNIYESFNSFTRVVCKWEIRYQSFKNLK